MRYDKITKQAYFETLLKSIMLQNTEKEQSKIKLKFIWLTKNLQRNNNVLTFIYGLFILGMGAQKARYIKAVWLR